MSRRNASKVCRGCAALRSELLAVRQQLEAALEAVAELRAEVARLQAKASRNSSNSSQPPSTDLGRGKHSGRDRKPTGRKPGGQPGHEKADRELMPPEDVDEVHTCKPKACTNCGARLQGNDPNPRRHQITEIPPVRPYVTEYQLHTLVCACGTKSCGTLPDGVPTGCFGPRLQATVATLTGVHRVSRRHVQAFLADSFGVDMSLGAISKQESIVSMALIEPVREALEYVRSAEIVHADETSWRERGERAWLWVAETELVTAFLIRPSRGRIVAEELLGDRESGVMVSDRYAAYSWIDGAHRQVCWAHLIRDFRRIREAGGEAGRIGKALLRCAGDVFEGWNRVRDGTFAREEFATAIVRIRKRVRNWLTMGEECGVPGIGGMCRGILKDECSMWTFVSHPGVEPTNNAAERAIRPLVLLRRSSQGTQSRIGSLFVERLQTVSATLRKQGRGVFEYIFTAVSAALSGEAAPSLLPTRE